LGRKVLERVEMKMGKRVELQKGIEKRAVNYSFIKEYIFL